MLEASSRSAECHPLSLSVQWILLPGNITITRTHLLYIQTQEMTHWSIDRSVHSFSKIRIAEVDGPKMIYIFISRHNSGLVSNDHIYIFPVVRVIFLSSSPQIWYSIVFLNLYQNFYTILLSNFISYFTYNFLTFVILRCSTRKTLAFLLFIYLVIFF